MKLFSFPKSRRLRTNQQFKAVITHKAYVADSLLKVYAAPNKLDFSRLGVSIAGALGPAVTRNRLKRLTKEAFRLNQKAIPTGFDYVVTFRYNWWANITGAKNPKTAARKLKLRQVADSFLGLAEDAAEKAR